MIPKNLIDLAQKRNSIDYSKVFFFLLKSDTKIIYKHTEMAAIFLFSIHIFSLSRDAFAEKLFLFFLFFPPCALTCVFFVRLRKNKMKKNHKHAAKQFYRFFVSCLTRLSFSRRLAFSLGTDCESMMLMMTKKALQGISKFAFSETKKNIS